MVRSLLEEAARAELQADGGFIDLGTADRLKYTRGDWGTGWGAGVTSDGVAAVELRAGGGALEVATGAAPVRSLLLRGRAPGAPARVRLALGGTVLGEADLGRSWRTVELAVPRDAVKPGPPRRSRERLVVEPLPEGTAATVQLAWVWFRTTGGTTASRQGPPVGPRVAPVRLGATVRRALVTSGARRYSFHLQVPPGAELRFGYGATAPTPFSVVGVHPDGRSRELWRATSAGGGWQDHRVKLAVFGGGAMRLDLVTERPRAAGAVRGGWSEPEIVAVGAPRVSFPPGPRPRHLILIVVDAMRADLLPPAPALRRAHLPALERLAASGVSFSTAYANANWTLPSMATILSGTYPHTHGARDRSSRLPVALPLLAERLQERGFATGGFHANPFSGSHYGFARGWDVFHGPPARWPHGKGTETLYRGALDWVRAVQASGRPFFLSLHTIDMHVPYEPPASHVARYHPAPYRGPLGPVFSERDLLRINGGSLAPAPADLAWLQALYRGAATFHDEHLDRLLEGLRSLGALEAALVVVTADHGEQLFEHGSVGHLRALFDEEIRVPLVMSHPGSLPAGLAIGGVVELVDLVPTVLELLGAAPPRGVDGASLVPWLRGAAQPRFEEALTDHSAEATRASAPRSSGEARSLRLGPYKLVVPRSGLPQLYDLGRDPGETVDVAARLPIARRLCEVHFGDVLGSPAKATRRGGALAVRAHAPAPVRFDPALQRQLEALGYLGP